MVEEANLSGIDADDAADFGDLETDFAASQVKGDASGTKIDYSSYDPVPFKKTATLVNYFISNTAQFLNTFAQVAETKLHTIDARLDEVEQILALYEAKLDLDDEIFSELPEIPQQTFAPQHLEIVTRTENPLQDAIKPVQSNNKKVENTGGVRGKTVKGVPKQTEMKKNAQPSKPLYVPPPPKDGMMVNPPPGMAPVKSNPVSSGPPPSILKIPNVESAPPPSAAAGDAAGASAEGQDAAAPMDDGFTPEQRRKNELDEDEGFKHFRIMKKNRIPLIRIIDRIQLEGKYSIEDIKLYATDNEWRDAEAMLNIGKK